MTAPRWKRPDPRLAVVLGMLVDAAEGGKPCPNNEVICDKVGLSSPAASSPMLVALENADLIRVERAGGNRRVQIIATGKWTGWTEIRRGTGRLVGRVTSPTGADRAIAIYRGHIPDSARVHREPCPRCGVRADVGCRHSGQARTIERRQIARMPLDGAMSAYARAVEGVRA
jgi:hypothetical protein